MLYVKRTCKEVAAMVVAREDRALSMLERVELRTHMWICKACPQFERQMLTMRNAMRQWRNYTDDVDGGVAAVKPVAPVDKPTR
jgi:Putative zinc-finger